MKNPVEMHPRIFERRKAVFYCQLQYVSPEDEEQALADWVSHYEGKLPRPVNYRKKTTERLRLTLRKIDYHLNLFMADNPRGDSRFISELSAMNERHRGFVIKELHRRMIVKATKETAGGG